jgi:hypothetical protein
MKNQKKSGGGTFAFNRLGYRAKVSLKIIQGVHKVLKPFVFGISSWSLRAQTKFDYQIKAKILKFMLVCGKSQFGPKIMLWHQNKEIVRFLPFCRV